MTWLSTGKIIRSLKVKSSANWGPLWLKRNTVSHFNWTFRSNKLKKEIIFCPVLLFLLFLMFFRSVWRLKFQQELRKWSKIENVLFKKISECKANKTCFNKFLYCNYEMLPFAKLFKEQLKYFFCKVKKYLKLIEMIEWVN